MSYNSKILGRYLDYCDKIETGLMNDCNRNLTILEMVQLKYNQTIDDINTKIYVESGSFDDADYLYQEAEEQAAKEQVGPIKAVINAFTRFITFLVNKIKSLLGILPDEQITVDKTDVENLGIITKHINGFKDGIDKIKNKDFVGGGLALASAAIPELLAAGAVAGTIVLSKSKLTEDCNLVTKFTTNILDVLHKIQSFIDSNKIIQATLTKISDGIKNVQKFVTDASTTVTNLISGIGKNNENIDVTKIENAKPSQGHHNPPKPQASNANSNQPQNNKGTVQNPPAVVGKNEVVPVDRNKTAGSNNPTQTPPGNLNNNSNGSGRASVHDVRGNSRKQLPPPAATGAVAQHQTPPPKSGSGQTSAKGTPYRSPQKQKQANYVAASYNEYDYDDDSFFENYGVNDYDNYDYDDYTSYESTSYDNEYDYDDDSFFENYGTDDYDYDNYDYDDDYTSYESASYDDEYDF